MFSEVYILAIALLAGPVSAFWRLPCEAQVKSLHTLYNLANNE